MGNVEKLSLTAMAITFSKAMFIEKECQRDGRRTQRHGVRK
jgi:hypothetical protein